MNTSISGIRRHPVLAILATLLIAAMVVIPLIGISTSTVSAADPYMYVDWPTQGSEVDLYLDSGATGPLAGWCASKSTYIYVGTHYAYSVYDYYAGDVAALPSPTKDYVKNIDWNRVTYIMNHIVAEASSKDIQEAVWYYTNGFVSTLTKAVQMVADAEANGAGYVPGTDASKLIIVDMGPNIQMQFYMIPPVPEQPLPEMPSVALFGIGVLGLAGFVWQRKRNALAKQPC